MAKITLYTAQCGDYHIAREDGLIPKKGSALFVSDIMNAKLFKCLGHLYYPDAEILIWIDGNIMPLISAEELVEKYLGDADFAVSQHPVRNCIYQEFQVLQKIPRFAAIKDRLIEQEQYYRSTHFPTDFGLWENNFFIRRNCEKVNAFMNEWFAELCRWQYRDQVSFPYVLRRHFDHFKFNSINLQDIRENQDFKYIKHYDNSTLAYIKSSLDH